jgi:hypothetical protein
VSYTSVDPVLASFRNGRKVAKPDTEQRRLRDALADDETKRGLFVDVATHRPHVSLVMSVK